MAKRDTSQKKALTVQEAADELGVSRSFMYELLNAKVIGFYQHSCGAKTFRTIPRTEIEAYKRRAFIRAQEVPTL